MSPYYIRRLFKNIITNLATIILNYLFRTDLRRIEIFRNSSKKKACFLFGSGFSLKYFDLKMFNEFNVIGCNWLIFHKDIDFLNIDFLIETDPTYCSNFLYGIRNQKQISLMSEFRNRTFTKRINTIEHVIAKFNCENNDNTYFISSNKPLQTSSFNSPCSLLEKENQNINGALRFQIILAIYLGYDEVILVGHDYLCKSRFGGHWYEKGQIPMSELTHAGWNTKFLLDAQKYIKIKILTVEDVELEFQSISYEKYFNKKPEYQENIELMTEKDWKILKTDLQYKV